MPFYSQGKKRYIFKSHKSNWVSACKYHPAEKCYEQVIIHTIGLNKKSKWICQIHCNENIGEGCPIKPEKGGWGTT